MIFRSSIFVLLFFLLQLPFYEAKTLDPYKVLGVDKNASQREIQKAFHKLSLKYHPDKNKDKSAAKKFTEISNAYDILSDEEKKKNYDLYGDEKGNPGFDGGNYNNGDGYTYYTSGRPGGGAGFSAGPGSGWQTMGGGPGNSRTYSFSFGGNGPGSSGGNPFGFDFGDMFSNMFSGGMGGGMGGMGGGMGGPNQHGSFGGSGQSKSGPRSSGVVEEINLNYFNKNIKDGGMTWLLLYYSPLSKEYHAMESVVQEVANSLNGALKAGKINCASERTLCKDISPLKTARVFVYSYRNDEKGSLVEYAGDYDDARSLKSFCLDYLPRFSKQVDLRSFDLYSNTKEKLPKVLLLSSKKESPAMWRAVSGMYHKTFAFYDAQVKDISHPMLKRLGVEAVPAVIGVMVNGETVVLKAGISVKDLKTGINELKALLESFEKKNKKAASSQSKKTSDNDFGGYKENRVPYLTSSNMDYVCGDDVAVCIVGVFRSSKAKEKLEAILSEMSQKSFVRRQNQAYGSGDSLSYSLVDATKQSGFLYSFDKAGYSSLDKLLIAYKPKRRKAAVYTGKMTMEEVEKFVSSVLSGDVRFSNILKKPVLK